MTDLRPSSLVGLLSLWSALVIASNVTAQAEPGVGLANPLAAQSLEELNVTRERPLFAPSRRAPPVAAAPVARRAEPVSPLPPPSVVLFGIIADADGARAIIRAEPTGQVVRGKNEGPPIVLIPCSGPRGTANKNSLGFFPAVLM